MIYLSPANHNNLWVDGVTTEKKYCEKIANKIKTINSNVYVASVFKNGDYTGRPEEARDKGCDTYIAIHTNAYEYGVKTTGCVAFYHPDNIKSKELAEKLVEAMNGICPIESNRAKSVLDGISESNYPDVGLGEIREPHKLGMTPVLLEINFHTYKPTATWMKENVDLIASKISEVIGGENNKNKIISLLNEAIGLINESMD